MSDDHVEVRNILYRLCDRRNAVSGRRDMVPDRRDTVSTCHFLVLVSPHHQLSRLSDRESGGRHAVLAFGWVLSGDRCAMSVYIIQPCYGKDTVTIFDEFSRNGNTKLERLLRGLIRVQVEKTLTQGIYYYAQITAQIF